MCEEKINQELRLKNIDETSNYLNEEINQNELMSKKHKKVYRVFNYIEHLFIVISTISSFSIYVFASLARIPVGITTSAIGLKMCVITAGIKKYNSIIKKKKGRSMTKYCC